MPSAPNKGRGLKSRSPQEGPPTQPCSVTRFSYVRAGVKALPHSPGSGPIPSQLLSDSDTLCSLNWCSPPPKLLGYHSFLFFKDFIYLWEKKGGRKRGRETLIGCLLYSPQPGTSPASQACALTRNWTSDIVLCTPMPNQLKQPARATTLSLHHV